MKAKMVCAFLLLLVLTNTPALAQETVGSCGTKPPGETAPLRATLTPDDSEGSGSTNVVTIEGDDVHPVRLVWKVSGCRLTALSLQGTTPNGKPKKIDVSVSSTGEKPLPDAAIGEVRVQPKATVLVVAFDIDGAELEFGSYALTVLVASGMIAESSSGAVLVHHTIGQLGRIGLFSIGAALGVIYSFVVAWFGRPIASRKLKNGGWLAGVVVAIGVAWTTIFWPMVEEADVWNPEPYAVLLVIVGVAAATAGGAVPSFQKAMKAR